MNTIDMHTILPVTESDKSQLLIKLKLAKNEFRLQFIIFFIIWLISPYLGHIGSNDALINDMSYGMALLYMSFFFIGFLAIDYARTVRRISMASETDYKRSVYTLVVRKKRRPVFHKKAYCLVVSDPTIHKLYFPREGFDQFQPGDMLYIEISGKGKQVLCIKKPGREDI